MAVNGLKKLLNTLLHKSNTPPDYLSGQWQDLQKKPEEFASNRRPIKDKK